MSTRLASGLAAIIFASACADAGEIHVRRECTCQSALVKLSDVADIFSDNDEQVQALARVELFPAPAAGQVRRLAVRELYDLLAARGVDLRQNRLAGASSVVIAGSSLPAIEPAPPRKSSAISADDNLVQLVIATRSLARGELVHESDVKVATLGAGSARADSADDLSEVVGRELTRPVASGQPLPRATLQSPRLVRKNEIVTLLVRAHGIQVRTSAKAQEEGGLDDLIRLESLLDRNTVYMARVTAYKEAEILAGVPRIAEPTEVPLLEVESTVDRRKDLPRLQAVRRDTAAQHCLKASPNVANDQAAPLSSSGTRSSLFGLRVRGADRAAANR